MKREELFDLLEYADDKYIEDAICDDFDESRPVEVRAGKTRITPIKIIAPIAAAIALTAAAGVAVSNIGRIRTSPAQITSAADTPSETAQSMSNATDSDPVSQNTNNGSKPQTFTKDSDGIVLTVTTDKSEYGTGEPINVTATLENRSGKDINLYYGMAPIGYTVELAVDIEHLIGDPIEPVCRAAMVTIIPVKPGERFVQNFKFQTYTGIEETISDGNIKYSPDFQKVAEAGLYNGTCGIRVCSNIDYPHGDITNYSLDFSVTLI